MCIYIELSGKKNPVKSEIKERVRRPMTDRFVSQFNTELKDIKPRTSLMVICVGKRITWLWLSAHLGSRHY